MPGQEFPLLLFPTPATAERGKRGGGGAAVTWPSGARQGARLAPRFNALRAAFDAEHLRLQQVAPGENPEFVVVLETIGTVENFAKAVAKIPDLEWLFESALDQIA